MFKSLKGKFTAIFIAVVIAAIFSVSGVVIYQANKLITTSVETNAQQNVETAVEKIQGFVGEQSCIGTVLAENINIKEFNTANLDSQILEILTKRQSLRYITISSEKTGAYFGYSNENGTIKPWTMEAGYDPRTREWYQFVKEQGKLCFTPAYLDTANNNEYVVTSGVPFFDQNNQFSGVITVDIGLDNITNFVSDMKFGETGYAFLLDSTGIFLTHPSQELIGTNATELEGKVGQISKEMVSGAKGLDRLEFQGAEQYIFYAPIPLTGWSLGVCINTDEVMAPVSKLLRTVMIIGLIALVITVLVSLVVATRIAKPIIEVKDQLKEMAQGEGDLTKRLEAKSEDEVGELTQWFNQFIDKLGSIIYQVQNTSSLVKTTSSELSMNAMESTKATEQVATAIEQIAKGATEQTTEITNTVKVVAESSVAISQMAAGAEEQNQNVIDTTDMVTDMVDKIDKMTKDMEDVRDVSRDTEIAAEQGEKEVIKTIEGMLRVKETSNESAQKINELGEQSKKIGDIVQVIDEIAEQTNLLALNAAIEAARAGEHGKGFAVVADEVRKLAERSSQATKEIADLISGIQSGVDGAVRVIEVNTEEVEQGVSMAKNAGEALTKILTGVKTSDKSIQQVMDVIGVIHVNSQEVLAAVHNVMKITEQNSTATEQISASSENVNSLMADISSISEETAASAEEVSASTEELNASIEEMSSSSSKLTTMAEELHNLVGQFKVRRD